MMPLPVYSVKALAMMKNDVDLLENAFPVNLRVFHK